MKIYLFLQNEILTFLIPLNRSGSFSFDENIEEESKLINIEVRNDQWTIYSTTDSQIISGNKVVSERPLKPNTYYILRRNNVNYLIYATEAFDDSFVSYTYQGNLNLEIGNNELCNVRYECQFLSGVVAKIYQRDGNLMLDVLNDVVYVNNNNLHLSTYVIKNGDTITIYGLKMVFFSNILFMNNPSGHVAVAMSSTNLSVKTLLALDHPQDMAVKDTNLYSREQYFFKAPRIRRTIKTKEIKLSPPPKQNGADEMPLILTIGPMMTMGVISIVMLVNTVSKLYAGTTTLQQSWPQLATSSAMVISMLVWPMLTKRFNRKLKARKRKELIEKYTAYLAEKRKELIEESNLQKAILVENLISVEDCLKIIDNGKLNFWDKRIEQSDFLEVRIGMGNELLDAKVNYSEEDFTVEEDELRKQADALVTEFQYIYNVPIGYSLFENKITALVGIRAKSYGLIDNILLQLLTFYSYDDIKFVVFTNERNEQHWDYLKYLNHSFNNDKSFRFFSSNVDEAKQLSEFLNQEIQNRIQMIDDKPVLFKPYYVVIVDDYDSIKRHNFIKLLTEIDANLGFSLVLIEDFISKLPSKCNNFISMGETKSLVLKNSFEQQEQQVFQDEINYYVDMMQVVRKLSNIPIEFQEGNQQLPNAISFLEMEKVGKVEQLNILNRWNSNDSTTTLRTEVGVDEDNNLMYLDLHEKYHGPHGLIAGMTGSGKSEFIITYILSMAINYSPNDVAFILIDYKGGGLAFAFENKAIGVTLPHLAGTITNLDKAEMDRSLVSIDSEVKRRQKIFNEARDQLGESTIDIYKYQRYFKEGRLSEPVPHLFIICDEFAELKSQQPEFMDNLISVARIGRSLGVHLILATQKPSGVVNDQIWSNTKFRVCLKVQDASDSKEMLKRPEAASLKQTGRFYLQVGYDEYFALGQSAWCGAKYFPSDKIIKQVNKSVDVIDDTGTIIKSIQAGNQITIEAQGEQLAAILQNIIETANLTHLRTKRLWLNDIEPIILVDNLMTKYQLTAVPYQVKAIIGEYDAPENQEQGILEYSYQDDGNTIIYGNDEPEREKLLHTILYSTCIAHTSKEIHIYAIDYGSESLRMFEGFPQVGGIVFMDDEEKFKNLFKFIMEEIRIRKKLLNPYGGSFETYNNQHEDKLPRILFVINNYEGILESYNDIYEEISSICRDCERYGITTILTCNMPATLGRRVSQCFDTKYALHLTDPSDYFAIFNMKCKVKPRDIFGRGLAYNGDVHEFQTASIVDDTHSINKFIGNVSLKLQQMQLPKAPPIPALPERVSYDLVAKEISTMQKVPIGISKDTLKVVKYDFTMYPATIIASNKLVNVNAFMDSFLDVLLHIDQLAIFFIDALSLMPSVKDKTVDGKRINYFDHDFSEVFEQLTEIQKNPNNQKFRIVYIVYELEKLKTKVESTTVIENLFQEVKNSENANLILCDSTKALKSLDYESWYSSIKNSSDGIWVGTGFAEQQTFRISKLTKEMSKFYPNNYGFCLIDNTPQAMKLLEFKESLNEEDDENGE